jgi:hypothetical protein
MSGMNLSNMTLLPEETGGLDIPIHSHVLNRTIGIEIKQTHTDTMGGTSLKFHLTGGLSPVPLKHIDAFDSMYPTINARISDSLHKYLEKCIEYIDEYNLTSPSIKYQHVVGFPALIPVSVRRRLVKEGFQAKIQSKYSFNIDPFKAFYRGKKNSYIQIGNRGFYHLGENPLNLPVPELVGSISMELRLLAAGTNGKPYAKVEIALKFKGLECVASPYTLNDPAHIRQLFVAESSAHDAQ